MPIAIDLGNTLAKAALFEGDTMMGPFVFDPENSEELIEMFAPRNTPEVCMIASVREIPETLIEKLSLFTQVSILDHKTKLPFSISYETPETLGRDRIAAVAAAWKRFPGQNVLVIDMGTCITYDLLTKEGVYQGGAISPGIHMRFNAMHKFTNKLPLATPAAEVLLTGKTTIASLQSGVMNGVQAEIEALTTRYEALYEDLTVLIGGGDNKYFDKKFKINIFAASNLVLEGLKVIIDFNEIE
ncbi:MAG: type III pantothenate kinase [Bacteroidales bacterium]|nr:type III pantothenate kinase [Bacteroidales bacterium]